MLSFLHQWDWDYCGKCEFDRDVKIENYYYHDGEQLGLHIRTQSKKKDVLVIFILMQVTKIPIYLTKTVFKRTSNATFNMKKVDLDES